MMGPVSAQNRVLGYASKYMDDVRGRVMSGKQLGRSNLESVLGVTWSFIHCFRVVFMSSYLTKYHSFSLNRLKEKSHPHVRSSDDHNFSLNPILLVLLSQALPQHIISIIQVSSCWHFKCVSQWKILKIISSDNLYVISYQHSLHSLTCFEVQSRGELKSCGCKGSVHEILSYEKLWFLGSQG